MKTLEILTHPNPVLKEICAPVTAFNDELRQLAEDMLYTIGPNEDNRRRIGVGLAAPQIGKAICLIVVAAPGFPEMAMVNPVITRSKGWVSDNEGCLSLPFHRGEVFRYDTIWATFQSLDGHPRTIKARDFLARVIQHETDHLDGIEFTDRIEEQRGAEVAK